MINLVFISFLLLAGVSLYLCFNLRDKVKDLEDCLAFDRQVITRMLDDLIKLTEEKRNGEVQK